jgi:hypothetical protein
MSTEGAAPRAGEVRSQPEVTLMTEELVEREKERSAPDPSSLLGLLRRIHGLQCAGDEIALLAAAADVFSGVLGSAPSAVGIVHEGGVDCRLGTAAAGSAAESLRRAISEGLPVLDARAHGAAALPVRGRGERTVGALYVAHPAMTRPAGPTFEAVRVAAEVVVLASLDLAGRAGQAADPRDGGAPSGITSLHDAKLAFERRVLEARLRECRGNVAAAARSLDMDRGQLSRLIKKHHLDRGRPPRVTGAPPGPGPEAT